MNKIGKKLHKKDIRMDLFLQNHKKIYIFGAGLVSRRLIYFLIEENIHISGVIVSKKNKNPGFFMGIKVYELSEISLTTESGIIIGVKATDQQEIIELLKSAGIKDEHILPQKLFNLFSFSQFPLESAASLSSLAAVYFKDFIDLNLLGCQKGTDKCSIYHNYLNKYEFFLKKWKEEKIILLELGVYKARSLYLWSEYFKNGTIYGVDIDDNCKKYETDSCKILIKDLADEDDLDKLSNLNPTIIIDDASHWWSHQIKALYHLFPSLKHGGIYILEDLGTSFDSYKFSNCDDANVSAYDFLLAINECVCSREPLRIEKLNPNLVILIDEIEMIAAQIEMMSFIHESCIIIKK